MTANTRQFIADKAGNRVAVLLPIGEYEELLEDLSDLKYFAEHPPVTDGPCIPLEEIAAELEAEGLVGDGANPLRRFTPLEAAMIGAGLAQSDPQRVSGAVCFVEAPRLPIEALFANTDDGESIEDFLENYPDTISRETVEKSLEVQRRLRDALHAKR